MRTTIAGINLTINASYKGVAEKRNDYHDKYLVVVRYEGKTKRFYFFDSVNDTLTKKDKALNEDELKKALWASLTDAECYETSLGLEDFCRQFGYNPYEGEGRKIYAACKRTHESYAKFLGKDNAQKIYEELSETY